MGDILRVIGLLAFCFLSFWLTNLLRQKTSFSVSRKVIHFPIGIGALLLPFLFDSVVYPLIVTGVILLVLLLARVKHTFHGFSKPGKLSEIWYALSSVICIAVAWNIDPWLAVTPILIMSWADGAVELVGRAFYRKVEHKGVAGTVAMAVLSMSIGAVALNPFWIGIAGGAVATIAESLGDGGVRDDNLLVPLAVLALTVPLYLFWG